MKTFSRPLFDEDSIALVSAGSLALVFELRCIDSKFSINRKKGHARDPKLLIFAATAYATLLLSARSLMSGTMVTLSVTPRAPISDTHLERKRSPKEQRRCLGIEVDAC